MRRVCGALRVALCAAIAGVPLVVAAQSSCTTASTSGSSCLAATVSFTLTASQVSQLAVSNVNPALGNPTLADFNAGYTNAAGPTATVWSNKPFSVTVVAPPPRMFTWSYAGRGTLANPNKPASDLLWGKASGTYGNNMGTTATLLSGNSADGVSATSIQQIFFQTKWNLGKDVPGTYSLTLQFTLSAP